MEIPEELKSEFEKFLNEALMRILINKEDVKSVLDEYHLKMQEVIKAYEGKK